VVARACLNQKGKVAFKLLKQGEMMNGLCYMCLMDKKLEFSMHQDETTHFHQDGAPCLNAKVVTQLFTERSNIKPIRWPGI
jgi:hypothetical protein